MQLGPNFAELARTCVARCQQIATFTEAPGCITRTFLSEPMRGCHRIISEWMQKLGMRVSIDAIGNLRGVLGSGTRPRLLLGSHLDTVPHAGPFDGVLGVCIALSVVESLRDRHLSFDIELFGFSEEEGVRFRAPFLGSLAAAGQFDSAWLGLTDASGCTVRRAIEHFGLDPAKIADAEVDRQAFAYLEFHIEQGPVLDNANESIAAVEAIAGQSRLEFTFKGTATHAGTTPMNARLDALAGAAEWITSVEQYAASVPDLVATVGKIDVSPNVSNAVPGRVSASLDVRHACDRTRLAAVQHICQAASRIAAARGLECQREEILNQNATAMDEKLVALLEKSIAYTGEVPRRMTSGAGHDAMILARKLPSVMLFIRSIGGISHHPDESVQIPDVEKAIRTGFYALTDIDPERIFA